MFYVGLYRENHETIFLSEITRPRALIFGMKHHLVNLYEVCSYYIPGAKNGPVPGSHVLHSVTCMLFIYFVYLVSFDPDIGEIDGK